MHIPPPKRKDNIEWLQDFYEGLCDGDWEHMCGFRISTLDNPGWLFELDLSETILVDSPFAKLDDQRSDDDWVICQIKDAKFIGAGGPQNLNEIISLFRNWVEKVCSERGDDRNL